MFALRQIALLISCFSRGAATTIKSRNLQSDDPMYRIIVDNDNDLLFTDLEIPPGAHEKGMWSRAISWPTVSIHLAVLPDGRVLCYGAPSDQRGVHDGREFILWDPKKGFRKTSRKVVPNAAGADTFCSGGTLRSTGEVLISGGSGADSGARSIESSFFNYKEDKSRRTADLNLPRWYGTMTNLPDGRALMTGGGVSYMSSGFQDPVENQRKQLVSSTPEIYEDGVGWRLLKNAFSVEAFGASHNRYWYPHQWVTKTGTIFGISTDKVWELDIVLESIKIFGDFKTPPNRDTLPNVGPTSTAVMYDEGMIIQVGGNGYADFHEIYSSPFATVININDIDMGRVYARDTKPMNFMRQWANSAVLPNGKVLVTGGSMYGNSALSFDVVLEVEIWDPKTEDWTIGAKAEMYRGYHSSMIVLPNGAIFSSGGGVPGPVTNFNAEVYYPPYLFTRQGSTSVLAPRPKIISISSNAPSYDDEVQVQVAGGGDDVAEVSFSALPFVTHSFDSNQRRMTLSFRVSDVGVDVTMPSSANLAPPGYYYLSVLNSGGVPSASVIVGLNATPPFAENDAEDTSAIVTFYKDANYKGTSWDLSEGTYDQRQITFSPIGKNEISSLRLRRGFAVESCTKRGGSGSCRVFTESTQELPAPFNDSISYIRVFKT